MRNRNEMYLVLMIVFFSLTTVEPVEANNATAIAQSTASSADSINDEFEKAFGKDGGMKEADQKAVDQDRLKLGGSLQWELIGSTLERSTQNDYMSNPASLELYLDSQLKNDLRAFFKGHLVHDGSIDESIPSPITGQAQHQSSASLDELKISSHYHNLVFWTVGKQKIKWGASRFWNPTDFLNLQRRDFLKSEDLRSGLSLVKFHIPWGASNFYLLGLNERVNDSSKTGVAGRLELPFKYGEWTLTQFSQKATPTRFGTDLSVAVWDFDFTVEAAQTDKSKEKSISGGVSYQVKYNDEDSVVLGAESFYQEAGADSKSDYLSLLTANKWVPFYVGKSYSMISVVLPSPGNWNDSSFSTYWILNNRDQSTYTQMSWVYTGIRDLSVRLALGHRGGEADSEMKIFGQSDDASLSLKVAF